jgi:hypothetical protein
MKAPFRGFQLEGAQVAADEKPPPQQRNGLGTQVAEQPASSPCELRESHRVSFTSKKNYLLLDSEPRRNKIKCRLSAIRNLFDHVIPPSLRCRLFPSIPGGRNTRNKGSRIGFLFY